MALALALRSASRACTRPLLRSATRAFAVKGGVEQGTVPSNTQGLTGRARDEALYQQAFGENIYDRDANAFFEEGTKENPIPILSSEDERYVGISLPDDSETRWFLLKKGVLAYDPDTANFFALKKVTDAEVQEWVQKAAGIVGDK